MENATRSHSGARDIDQRVVLLLPTVAVAVAASIRLWVKTNGTILFQVHHPF